jgi:hypothetical protein
MDLAPSSGFNPLWFVVRGVARQASPRKWFGKTSSALPKDHGQRAKALSKAPSLDHFKPVANNSCRGTTSVGYESDRSSSIPLRFSASRGRRSGGSRALP